MLKKVDIEILKFFIGVVHMKECRKIPKHFHEKSIRKQQPQDPYLPFDFCNVVGCLCFVFLILNKQHNILQSIDDTKSLICHILLYEFGPQGGYPSSIYKPNIHQKTSDRLRNDSTPRYRPDPKKFYSEKGLKIFLNTCTLKMTSQPK